MVATFEDPDSGPCAADAGTRRWFASDLLDLALAGSGRGGEAQVRAHRDNKDTREAHTLEGVLSRCAVTGMVVAGGREAAPAPSSKALGTGEADAVQMMKAWSLEGQP